MSWRLLEEPAVFDGLRTLTGGRRLAQELEWLSVDRVAMVRTGRLIQKSRSLVFAGESGEESRTSRYSRPGGQTAFRDMTLSEAARLLSYFVRFLNRGLSVDGRRIFLANPSS